MGLPYSPYAYPYNPKPNPIALTLASIATSIFVGSQPIVSPVATSFGIDIVNLNVSLDDRFCVEGSCKPRAGFFFFYVPISAYMPTIPLHLKFQYVTKNPKRIQKFQNIQKI